MCEPVRSSGDGGRSQRQFGGEPCSALHPLADARIRTCRARPCGATTDELFPEICRRMAVDAETSTSTGYGGIKLF